MADPSAPGHSLLLLVPRDFPAIPCANVANGARPMIASPTLLALSAITISIATGSAEAGSPPQGCIEMNGQVRCIQSTPSKTPDWDRTVERAEALGRNCRQWTAIHRKQPTAENATYRDAACQRRNEHTRTMRPTDAILESLGAKPSQ